MGQTYRARLIRLLLAVMLSFALVGCGSVQSQSVSSEPQVTTDELFSNSKAHVEIEVFKQGGRVYTVDGHYEIPELSGYNDLAEGGHYKLTADVTYLNGGVAGYVDYPQIDRIISIEEA